MRTTARAHGLLIVAVLLASSFAQQDPVVKALTKTPPAPAKPRLTEKQKQGLRMLDAAETEAAALQPDMRAYIEWQAALGYQKYDPKKSDELLDSAFNSTTAIATTKTGNCFNGKDEACRVKNWLQDEILEEMVKRSPDKAQDLSAKLDPAMKKVANMRLLDEYLEKKQYDKTKELLDGFAGEDGYPFREATTLMESIPESRRSEKLAVFSQAFANFQQYNTDFYPDDSDFAAMLVRCWKQLPPSIVLSAIDSILEKTTESSASDDELNKYHLGIMTAHHGTIQFNNSYALRLFELMPILRELDRTRSDQLLREQPDLQDTVKQFPNGVFSIDNRFGKQWSEKDEQYPEVENFAIPLVDSVEDREQSYLLQQDALIWEQVVHDPQQALATADNLPESTPKGHHPRFSALLLIADKSIKKDPDVSRTALAEARKSVDSLKPLWATDRLLEICDYYEQLGDHENAKSALLEAIKNVDQLYRKDSDVSDPNLGFKGNWPSAQLWGKCVRLAARVAPETVPQVISEIPDPEIMSFTKTMFANGLLGASSSGTIFVEIHKDGKFHYSGSR